MDTIFPKKCCRQRSTPKTQAHFTQNPSQSTTTSKVPITNISVPERQTLTFRIIINNDSQHEQQWKLKNIPLSHLFQDVKTKSRILLDSDGKQKGQLFITCERVDLEERNRKYKILMRSMINQNLFTCFGPRKMFFRIVRKVRQSGLEQQVVVYESEKMTNQENIVWPEFQIKQHQLRPFQKGQKEQQFSICFFQQSEILDNEVGFMNFKISALQQPSTIKSSHIIKQRNKKKKGQLNFISIQVSVQNKDEGPKSFIDLLKNGLKIRSAISIDFTESNGNYKLESSKHYFTKDRKSQYEQVMQKILNITLEYDIQKKAYVLGFGSVIKNHPTYDTKKGVSHCFPLTMSTQHPLIGTKQKIIQTYKDSIKYLQFAGPTYLEPTINWMIQECQKLNKQNKLQHYMIMVILTDGQLCDKQKTLDKIIMCSNYPISIVVVGIGKDQDFSIMHQLNQVDNLIDSSNRVPFRKLFKFVEYEKIKDNFRKEKDSKANKDNTLEELSHFLSDIPSQIVEYFNLLEKPKPLDSKRSIQSNMVKVSQTKQIR